MPALSKPNARDTRGADTTNEGFAACETCFDTQRVSPPTYMYALEHQQESIHTRIHTYTHRHNHALIYLYTQTPIFNNVYWKARTTELYCR